MASLLVRQGNQWLGFSVGPAALTVSLLQPSTSGQTKQLPFVFSANTSDNASVTKVELYYINLGSPEYIGETTSPGLGWAVALPADFPPGTWQFFMRAHTSAGFSDSPFVTVTITAAAATLTWAQPTTNGQTFATPMTVAFSASNPSAFSSVSLFRLVGGTETFVGSTTTYGFGGFTISMGTLTGNHTILGRGTLAAGGTVTTDTRTVTIATGVVTPPPASSLKTAIYFGGEDSHAAEANARMGYKLRGRMRFVVRASASACISDFTKQIDAVIARRNSDRFMMWLTIGLVMNDDTGLSPTANGQRDSSLWVPIGNQLNRLTDDDLRNLAGLRLGHEFMNAGTDYRWGVRNTTNNTSNLLTNAGLFVRAWKSAVDTMKGQLSTQAKKDALQLDWNSPGGQMIRTMTHAGGVNAWDLADACFPGTAYVSHVTTDIYDQERFRSNHTGSAPYVPIDGPDSPLAYVTSRAIRWGKKSGMSEGSAFMFKFKSGIQIGTDDGAATVKFVNDLMDWGATEAQAGRLSHITFFERDPYNEGFTAFIGGQRDTSARATGEERLWDLWRLLHPREAKTGGGFIPGGIPAGVTGVPNTLSRRFSAYTAVGGTRSRSVHSNAPLAAKALLDRVNP